MVYKNGTNAKIEQFKIALGITGDVYVTGEGNYIENLEGHKKLFPNSAAKTIEEAEAERLAYIEEEKKKAIEAAEKAAKEAAANKDGEANVSE